MVVPSSSRDVFVGRRSELDTLSRLHDEAGPRVLFVHGLAGSGKSCLVHRFAQRYAAGDPLLVVVDCRAVEPTEQGFLAAVADHVRGFAHLDDGSDAESLGVLDRLGGLRRRVVVCLDHYEVFRLLDTWLRLVVVPALPPNVALLIAGREEPHPA